MNRFRSPLRSPGPLLATMALLVVVAACDDPTKGQVKAGAAAPVASGGTAAAGATFTITPKNSQVMWTGSKVTGKHDGNFTSFAGAITVVDGNIEKSRVTVDIDTPSLTTVPENLIHHLKTADFFNVEQFPKATFASTSIKAGAEKRVFQVTGNLTLHGVTKSITFPATIDVSDDTVTVDSTFAINRKDFSINYPGKVDDVIRDDVLIKLELHAAKQAS